MFLLILMFPITSFAQQNFWTSILVNKCQQVRPTCQAHLTAGCKNSGIFKIGSNTSYFNGYCDQSTDGGGWLLVKRFAPVGDASSNSWTTKINVTAASGTLGSTLTNATDYHLATTQYPSGYSRYMFQRYKTISSVLYRSYPLSFDYNSSLNNFAQNTWVSLTNLKVNSVAKTGTIRNQVTNHISSGTCGASNGTSGYGELGICLSGDSSVNLFWGPNFDTAAYNSSFVRMLSYYTPGLGVYWRDEVGMLTFIK